MTSRRALVLSLVLGCMVLAATGMHDATAQGANGFDDPASIRQAIAEARADAASAAARGARLEKGAREATQAAEKTAREAAAVAARIQQSQAGIAAAEGRIALVESQRRSLMKRLAERREPLVRLTGALQNFARRPLGLAILRPGSLRETVYLRAMLDTTLPQVRQRTAALRGELERGRVLELEAREAVTSLEAEQGTLAQRRRRLAAIESRQRIEARARTGEASRETDRALALAEEARDLGTLVERLGEAGSLRDELAALPGPVLRPAQPDRATVSDRTAGGRADTGTAGPIDLQLPVAGRTLAGFGVQMASGVRSQGVTLAPRPAAQAVAPASGRVVFAGPYRGYGRIVIIDHGGGWTSLVTGLARTNVAVGDTLVAGSPLGVAGTGRPEVTLELRRDGAPVNPLDFIATRYSLPEGSP